MICYFMLKQQFNSIRPKLIKCLLVLCILTIEHGNGICQYSDEGISSHQYYREETRIGFESAITNFPYGFYISRFTPRLFNKPVMSDLLVRNVTDFKGEYDTEIQLTLFAGRTSREFHPGLGYKFEKISDEYQFVRNYNYIYLHHKLYSAWNFRRSYLYAGVGKKFTILGRNSILDYRIITEFHSFVPGVNANMLVSYDFWHGSGDFRFRVRKQIPRTHVEVGSGCLIDLGSYLIYADLGYVL
jgi:hypothetical protein